MASRSRLIAVLALTVPTSVIAKQLGLNDQILFFLSIAGLIPLAILLSTATEKLAERLGPSIGALLNALFGNATELIISLTALKAGLVEIVKASITGSVMANLLLAMGMSMLLGGIGRDEQTFPPVVGRVNGTAMTLALIAIVIPSISTMLPIEGGNGLREDTMGFSTLVAVILISVYILTLVFSLKTHSAKFAVVDAKLEDPESESEIVPLGPWVAVLLLATLGIAFESELFVACVETVTQGLGFNAVFMGVILLPLVGGVAEYVTAISMARKNRMDLSVSVALGSTLLIALLVVPILVLAGPFLGHPLDLSFGVYEVVAIIAAVSITNLVSSDGRSDWLEGSLLIATYGILAAGFFFRVSATA